MALKLKFRTLVPALFQAVSPMILTKVGSAYTLSFDASAAPTGPQGPIGPTGSAGAGYGGTSTTSLLIANSVNKVFTTQAALAYQAGNYIRATSAANSANYMEGTIVSYTAVTLTLAVTAIGGSGTFADWNFSIAGSPGSVGVASIAGNTGAWTLGNGLSNATNQLNLDPSFFPSFGGRLTALSAVAVPTVDVIGSQNLYYAPVAGGSKAVPTYASGKWSLKQFTASSTDQVGLTLALAGSASWAADSIHDVFAVIDSGTLKLATRLWDAGMYATVVQITNATTITTGTSGTAWTRSTGAFNGTVVQNGAASATIAPGNAGFAQFLGQDWGVGVTKTLSRVVMTAPTDHYIYSNAGVMSARVYGSSDNTNWFLLSVHWFNDASIGASYTFDINTDNQIPYRYHRLGLDGGAGGINTFFVAQVQFYNIVAPANGRRLTLHDGIWVNDASMTARTGAAATITTAQYEGVYLGAIHIDTGTAGQVSDCVTYQASATCGISNAYNKRKKVLRAGLRSTSTSYTLSSQVFTPCAASSTFSLQAFCGLAEDAVVARMPRAVTINAFSSAGGYEAAIGVDSTSSFSGIDASTNLDFTGQLIGTQITPQLTLPPYAGIHTLYGIERVNSGGGTVTVFNEARETVLQAEFMY